VLRPGALRQMVDFMEVSPRTGILGCRILNPDLSLQWSTGRGISHKFEYFRAGVLRPLWSFLLQDRHYHHTVEVSWVTGACLLARAEALRQVGPFDENIISYYEDADLCFRTIQAGWKVVFHPGPEIIHYLGGTRRHYLAREVPIIFQSGCYFFRKHYSPPAAALTWLFLLIMAIARYSGYLIFSSAPQRRELLAGYAKAIRFLVGIQDAHKITVT